MNRSDKARAEKYKRELEDRALNMYEKKKLKMVKKNHNKLEALKKKLENEEK